MDSANIRATVDAVYRNDSRRVLATLIRLLGVGHGDEYYRNVRELRHGERLELAPGFAVTSYQFYPLLDSALAVECEGVTLLDANDAKFMGRPLGQIR